MHAVIPEIKSGDSFGFEGIGLENILRRNGFLSKQQEVCEQTRQQ